MMRGLLLAYTVLLAGCSAALDTRPADFYECPDRLLRICTVGQAPSDPECRYVGTGQTTLPVNCP